MIRTHQLTYRVGSKALVEDVTLDFDPARLHVIIGVNGAGKSTLLRLLARLLKPTSGSVHYAGSDIAQRGEAELARHRAVLSQSIELGFSMPVRDVVMMGRYPHFATHAGPADERICHEVLDYCDARSLSDRDYSTLSGGEKQRVQFARVLAQIWNPHPDACRYLFLDEPLTFLDIRHQLEFMERMTRFARQSDVVTVVVLHDLNLSARFADRIVLLHEAHVAADGGPEILDAVHLKDTFGITPTFVTNPQTGRRHLILE